MTTISISEITAKTAIMAHEAAQLVAVLDRLMTAEPDHAKRGGLHRLRSALVDLHYGLRSAQEQFQATHRAA